MIKFGIKSFVASALIIFSCANVETGATANDPARHGRMLACFVYSLQTIPLLHQLQQHVKQDPAQPETQELIQAVGGQNKIHLALTRIHRMTDVLSVQFQPFMHNYQAIALY